MARWELNVRRSLGFGLWVGFLITKRGDAVSAREVVSGVPDSGTRWRKAGGIGRGRGPTFGRADDGGLGGLGGRSISVLVRIGIQRSNCWMCLYRIAVLGYGGEDELAMGGII